MQDNLAPHQTRSEVPSKLRMTALLETNFLRPLSPLEEKLAVQQSPEPSSWAMVLASKAVAAFPCMAVAVPVVALPCETAASAEAEAVAEHHLCDKSVRFELAQRERCPGKSAAAARLLVVDAEGRTSPPMTVPRCSASQWSLTGCESGELCRQDWLHGLVLVHSGFS